MFWQSFLLCLLFLMVPMTEEALGGLVGRLQSAGARGILKCNGKPAARVLVKLYDDDKGIDTDDFMGQTKTNANGEFEVSGYLHEMTNIDPKINVYHDCNDGLKPCQRMVSVMIPDGYITHGYKVPKKWYDAGTIELAGKFAGEKRDCVH